MRTRRMVLLALLLGLAPLACGGGGDGQDEPFTALEARTHLLINQERQAQGLPDLAWEELIADEARGHSEDMAAERVGFGHDGFEARIARLAEHFAYASAAENVAWNLGYPDPAAQAVEGWMDSPGHRDNILGAYDRAGIGVARAADVGTYFTQIFLQDP